MPDIARFYGIVLVYYGHIIERIMYLKDPTAALHYKFIYSFHMPFFFLLAGFVVAPAKSTLPVGRFLRQMAASRLAPYVFFSLLLALMSLIFPGHYVVVDLSSAKGYAKGLIATAMGFPVFNIPLWFMACLVVVEIMHRAWARLVAGTAGLFAVVVVCLLGGLWLNQRIPFLMEGKNFWIVNEAPVMAAFYLVGVFLRRREFLLGNVPRPVLVFGVLACIAAVMLTFDLNQGPFRLFQAVVVVLGAHGNWLLFTVTALAGSLALLYLARLTFPARWLLFMGRNVLILFCLNGVFYHYINGPFADWFMRTFEGGAWLVFGAGVVFTALSLVASVPFVLLFNRFIPQLVGKPRQSGPLLPALIRE
ncbi:fucose 4-O-acetylase and related acetyltransferase-like protein [Desulfovibrio ferrophilus]|uniref:Fucose 4-O-acetylase and related acetyltransferase-like protein n=2 Tax=Desulfovibrio ferrophilus TaxID=241368 RepID=A0A2Z6AVK3_9BACT|nr:fucose 4-O-acetylase and related acetyltransferase-like protein [Desulfovibrio ferrophilus]